MAKLKASIYSPIFRGVEKVKREMLSKLPPPGVSTREYDILSLEFVLAPFEMLRIIGEEVEKRARAEPLEKPRLDARGAAGLVLKQKQ